MKLERQTTDLRKPTPAQGQDFKYIPQNVDIVEVDPAHGDAKGVVSEYNKILGALKQLRFPGYQVYADGHITAHIRAFPGQANREVHLFSNGNLSVGEATRFFRTQDGGLIKETGFEASGDLRRSFQRECFTVRGDGSASRHTESGEGPGSRMNAASAYRIERTSLLTMYTDGSSLEDSTETRMGTGGGWRRQLIIATTPEGGKSVLVDTDLKARQQTGRP